MPSQKTFSKAFQTNPQNSFLIPQGELELFHYMMDHIGDEVLVVRRDGSIVFANKTAIAKFGYSKEVLLGMSIIDLFRVKISLAEWHKFYWDHVKKKGAPVSFAIECIGKRGRVHTADITAVYMPYKSEEYLLSVGRDITQQLSLQQKLNESEKMKALQNFIVGTIHEIQNPLKGILSHSQTLVEKYKDRAFEYIGYKEFKDIMQTLEAMRDQVKYSFDTTDKLLAVYARKMNLKGNYCDINEVIFSSIKSLKQSLEVNSICLDLHLARRLSLAAIGTLEFGQVMANILTNAIQAMPRGGIVHIKTSEDKINHKINIECRDEGVGISSDDLPRIFEPFFTTKNRGLSKSSGLGLTVVYSIIKSFHGEITFKSKLREGTSARISLDVYKDSRR